jgi:hypothetical protein
MIDLLLVLLRPALRAAEGDSKNPFDWLALLIAWPLDVLIAHTTWALVAGWPRKGEWTISHTLERLVLEQRPDRLFFVEIARYINRVSPIGRHIKNAAQSNDSSADALVESRM